MSIWGGLFSLYIELHSVKCCKAIPAIAGFHWLKMVRAKVVKHPRKWEHGGYHEIVKPKQRYRTINRKEVTRLLDVEEKEIGRQYQGWIKEALKQGNLHRNGLWTSELAVGDDAFVEKVKANLGRLVYPLKPGTLWVLMWDKISPGFTKCQLKKNPTIADNLLI